MKQDFDISGMTCSACSAHVQKAVEKLDGVSSAAVNLLTNSMKVVYDEKKTGDKAIISAVEKAGYGAAVKGGKAEGTGAKTQSGDKAYIVRLCVSVAFTIALMYFSMGGMIGLPQPPFMQGEAGAAAMAFTQMLLCLPVIYVNFAYFKNVLNGCLHSCRTWTVSSLSARACRSHTAYSCFICLCMRAARETPRFLTHICTSCISSRRR